MSTSNDVHVLSYNLLTKNNRTHFIINQTLERNIG